MKLLKYIVLFFHVTCLSFNVFSINYTLDETLSILSKMDEVLSVDFELQDSETFFDSSKNISEKSSIF